MNNKNDKKNNFATLSNVSACDLLELDAKYFDVVGGGIGGDVAGPVTFG